MLAAAPGLKVLTTSRARLRVYGEHAYTVAPLALPEIQTAPAATVALLDYGACRLFLERARAIKPEFSTTEEDARAVAEICIQLDGLPLAIELAAARVRLLPPRKMLEQLSSRLRFLTRGAADAPARHRTLRDTIDWSYELLEADEQRLFLRLAIFPGGCTLDAAEIVGNMEGEIDVLSAIESLVDKSLLTQNEAGDEPRFTMLETFREYALERLDADGDADSTHRTFAHYCVRLAEAANADLRAGTADAALELLEAEHDNLRAALRWAHERQEAEVELKLAATLWRFWEIRGYFTEGRQRLEQALAAGVQTSPELLADAHTGVGTMAYHQGQNKIAETHHKEALALYRKVGDRRGEALALNNIAVQVLYLEGDQAALPYFEQSLAVAREVGEQTVQAMALHNLAQMARLDRDYERSLALFGESLELCRAAGHTWGAAHNLIWTAHARRKLYQYDAADIDLRESLGLSIGINAVEPIVEGIEGYAALAVARQRSALAASLWGAAEKARAEHSMPLPADEREEYEADVAAAKTSLGELAFAAAWEEGHRLSIAQATELALAEG